MSDVVNNKLATTANAKVEGKRYWVIAVKGSQHRILRLAAAVAKEFIP